MIADPVGSLLSSVTRFLEGGDSPNGVLMMNSIPGLSNGTWKMETVMCAAIPCIGKAGELPTPYH